MPGNCRDLNQFPFGAVELFQASQYEGSHPVGHSELCQFDTHRPHATLVLEESLISQQFQHFDDDEGVALRLLVQKIGEVVGEIGFVEQGTDDASQVVPVDALQTKLVECSFGVQLLSEG